MAAATAEIADPLGIGGGYGEADEGPGERRKPSVRHWREINGDPKLMRGVGRWLPARMCALQGRAAALFA